MVILINSTDSFADAWPAFFRLFSIYWPDCPYRLVLNTETAEFEHSSLNIASLAHMNKKSWSSSLIEALRSISDDYVLYLQEDYFLRSKTNTRQVQDALDWLIMEDLDCVQLTHIGSVFMNQTSNRRVPKDSNYFVSTQAAIWRKDSLLKILRPWETGWNFEHFGSLRARNLSMEFGHIDRTLSPVLNYVNTGIVKGKWNKDVVDLFARHEIYLDYSTRGFYDRSQYRLTLKSKIKMIKNIVKSTLDNVCLKIRVSLF